MGIIKGQAQSFSICAGGFFAIYFMAVFAFTVPEPHSFLSYFGGK